MKQGIFYKDKLLVSTVSTLIVIFIITFGLASAFKKSFWLKIPVGAFLLVVTTTAYDAYHTKGLIICVIALVLPYINIKHNPINRLAKFIYNKRKNNVLDFNKVNLNANPYSNIEVKDNGYHADERGYKVNDIEIKEDYGYTDSVGTEVLMDIYIKRSLFLPVIFFTIGIILYEFYGISYVRYLRDFIGQDEVAALIAIGSLFLIAIIELSFLFSEDEYSGYIQTIKNRCIEKRHAELEELAKAEHLEALKKHREKQKKERKENTERIARENIKRVARENQIKLEIEHQNSIRELDDLIDRATKAKEE